MKVEVSVGELLDKYSILEIKKELLGPSGKKLVELEISVLRELVEGFLVNGETRKLYEALRTANRKIWDDMEQVFNLRAVKSVQYFAAIESTIDLNIERSYLKRQINILSESTLLEAKSYFEEK